jgi:hypothetical protein
MKKKRNGGDGLCRRVEKLHGGDNSLLWPSRRSESKGWLVKVRAIFFQNFRR